MLVTTILAAILCYAQNNLVTEMATQKLLFFGVHGESAADQQLAAGVMGRIATKLKENVAVGLEQVTMGEVLRSASRICE